MQNCVFGLTCCNLIRPELFKALRTLEHFQLRSLNIYISKVFSFDRSCSSMDMKTHQQSANVSVSRKNRFFTFYNFIILRTNKNPKLFDQHEFFCLIKCQLKECIIRYRKGSLSALYLQGSKWRQKIQLLSDVDRRLINCQVITPS